MNPAVAFAVIASFLITAGCTGLRSPVDGDVVRGFAPIRFYAGHWGADFAVPEGTPVRATADGTVAFVGTVVGNRTVSIDHGGGVRTSYSYLGRTVTSRGSAIRAGTVLGTTGRHGGRAALHFSLRVGGRYVDPVAAIGCLGSPGEGLWLRGVGPPTPYALGNAWNPRWHVRSASRGPSRGRRSGVPATRSRRCHLHPGGRPVAEGLG